MNGKLKMPSSISKMSRSSPRIKKVECGIEADNRKIYEKYGLTKQNISVLLFLLPIGMGEETATDNNKL